jgi:hypothetical protein
MFRLLVADLDSPSYFIATMAVKFGYFEEEGIATELARLWSRERARPSCATKRCTSLAPPAIAALLCHPLLLTPDNPRAHCAWHRAEQAEYQHEWPVQESLRQWAEKRNEAHCVAEQCAPQDAIAYVPPGKDAVEHAGEQRRNKPDHVGQRYQANLVIVENRGGS